MSAFYDNIKTKLLTFISTNKTEKTNLYYKIGDLYLVFAIILDQSLYLDPDFKIRTGKIDYKFLMVDDLAIFGISLETLKNDALANMERLYPAEVVNFADYIQEAAKANGTTGSIIEDDHWKEIYIVTNVYRDRGAVSVFRRDLLKRVFCNYNCGFWVIPTSIHEAYTLPCDKFSRDSALNLKMFSEIGDSQGLLFFDGHSLYFNQPTDLKGILQTQMDQKKISIKELSQRSKVTEKTIKNILNGKEPRLETLYRLGDGLQMPVSEFFKKYINLNCNVY